MKNNIVEEKEGIFYFFKTLFGNTQKEQDLDNIINSEKIDDNTKKEIENSQKRIKEMLKDERPIDEKMEILMEILFTEEEAQVYRRRYEKS